MNYNWQQKDWPEFTFDLQEIDDTLFVFASETGPIKGMLNPISDNMKMEAIQRVKGMQL